MIIVRLDIGTENKKNKPKINAILGSLPVDDEF